MSRTVVALVFTALVSVFGLAQAAHADDGAPPPTSATVPTIPGYVQPPYVCGPTQAPSQVPCDQPGAPTTTTPPSTVNVRYCLGYPQQFPADQPCPKPPTDICAAHPEQFECHDPTRTDPVAPVPGGTVPTTTTTTAPEAATAAPVDVQVSSVQVVNSTQHRGTQRRSAAPATLPTTGSSSGLIIAVGVVALLVGGALLLLTGRRVPA